MSKEARWREEGGREGREDVRGKKDLFVEGEVRRMD